MSAYIDWLDATIAHLENLKRDGKRFVPVSRQNLNGLVVKATAPSAALRQTPASAKTPLVVNNLPEKVVAPVSAQTTVAPPPQSVASRISLANSDPDSKSIGMTGKLAAACVRFAPNARTLPSRGVMLFSVWAIFILP